MFQALKLVGEYGKMKVKDWVFFLTSGLMIQNLKIANSPHMEDRNRDVFMSGRELRLSEAAGKILLVFMMFKSK